jgi:hypothetical protein
MSPMDEVQDHMAALAEQQSRLAATRSTADKIVNFVPYFGDGYYEEPLIGYGQQYAPQQ